MDEQQEKRELEAMKFNFEAFKHLTTLSTGTLLVIFAVYEKLQLGADGGSRKAILFACAMFLLAIGGGALGLIGIATFAEEAPFTAMHKKANSFVMLTTMVALGLGFGSLLWALPRE